MDEQLLLEQIEKELLEEFTFPVFEVARSRPAELKQMEKTIEKLSDTKFGSKERLENLKKLASEISKFSKVKRVTVKMKKKYPNVTVLTHYNNLLPELYNKKIKPEESYKYIKSFHIVIGEELFKLFTSKELVSVLLHELGHVFQHTSGLGAILPTLLKKLTKLGFIVGGLTNILSGGTLGVALAPLVLLTFALSRSLTFAEHMEELNADDYSVKYGYGDELAKAFNKFIKAGFDKKVRRPKNWLGRIVRFFRKIFTLSSHPDTSDRICEIIRKMKEEHKKQYPKLSKEISTIYADIRC